MKRTQRCSNPNALIDPPEESARPAAAQIIPLRTRLCRPTSARLDGNHFLPTHLSKIQRTSLKYPVLSCEWSYLWIYKKDVVKSVLKNSANLSYPLECRVSS